MKDKPGNALPIRATDIDQHVGERIRQRRILLGYTQEQLAETLSISYQQVQKYETGANRVSAGRLFQISKHLDVPVGYFFDGIADELAGEGQSVAGDGSYRRIIELVRHFQSIVDPAIRNSVLSLVKTLAGSAPEKRADEAEEAGEADLAANGSGNGHMQGNGQIQMRGDA